MVTSVEISQMQNRINKTFHLSDFLDTVMARPRQVVNAPQPNRRPRQQHQAQDGVWIRVKRLVKQPNGTWRREGRLKKMKWF